MVCAVVSKLKSSVSLSFINSSYRLLFYDLFCTAYKNSVSLPARICSKIIIKYFDYGDNHEHVLDFSNVYPLSVSKNVHLPEYDLFDNFCERVMANKFIVTYLFLETRSGKVFSFDYGGFHDV